MADYKTLSIVLTHKQSSDSAIGTQYSEQNLVKK